MVGLLILPACQSPSPVNPQPAGTNNLPLTIEQTIEPTPPDATNQTTEQNTAIQADNSNPQNNATISNNLNQMYAFNTNSPKETGTINQSELSEISGLASSARRNNTLWAINDSGNQPKLFALKHTGEPIGSFEIAVKNLDWEDLASAWINGESYLLIGDIGDNRLSKDEHDIYIIPEPLLDDLAVEPAVKPIVPAYTLRFRYPDGRHNSESMAFADGWVYILTKEPQADGKRQASQVYRVPLDLTKQSRSLVAEKITSLAIPSNSILSRLISSIREVDISQPTAFDIDAQNRYAYVLTYRSVYRYKRELDESWAQVLAEPRKRIHTHSLSQAEALAVAGNGVVWFTTEKRPAPLWALPPGK